ncbi:ATP-binding protein [Paenibacillus radicis (ex Xue et al. 2023)]|uniref:ATP-binding protein n=1 Tax=Paenibacillus radicis (ex Xue et al. 2023) TaxID=2972489 RepID=A0ABT1YQR6_9BACL|nr:ATP-binding protein [Paenibacillus radicis (ex Xue et al. 2023)]MCR8635513.1 ATP-binding protein [Paenibacillus radicis (ex Xue et al. 2023)]
MMDSWGTEAEKLEASTFIGRESEQAKMLKYLKSGEQAAPLLNIYGTGGVGKSRLVRQYGCLARGEGAVFVLADFRNVASAPEDFEAFLKGELGESDRNPVNVMNEIAAKSKVVLALDSYERAAALDQWLRESFISQLAKGIVIVISGRYPLDGEWLRSSFWRQRIETQPLRGFTDLEVRQFLGKHGMTDEVYLSKVAAWSKGLPPALSLLPPTEPREAWPDLGRLSGQWLWETMDGSLRRWTEYASVTRIFNQEMLGRISGSAPSEEEFEALTRLSFISDSQRGWYVQEGIREAGRSGIVSQKQTGHIRGMPQTVYGVLFGAGEKEDARERRLDAAGANLPFIRFYDPLHRYEGYLFLQCVGNVERKQLSRSMRFSGTA